MLYLEVESTVLPDRVVLGDVVNPKNVVLSDNITDYTDEDGNKFYKYDEVRFQLPYDRQETLESISENFEDWWIYGSDDSYEDMSLEERVTTLEELVISLLEV